MRTLLIPFFFLIASAASAQSDSLKLRYFLTSEGKEEGLVLGIHQYDNTFFELGYSHLYYRTNHCAFGTDIHGYTLSAEYNPFGKRAGLSVMAWSSMMTVIMMGINANTYTDGTHWDMGIKPLIGLGPGYWQLLYGYDLRLAAPVEGGINKHHSFILRFHIPIVKKEMGKGPMTY